MRYCPVCDTEYRDDVATCREDGSVLLDRTAYEAELRRQGRQPLSGDIRVVGVLGSQFEADQIAEGLAQEEIEVTVVPTKAPTVEPMTDPGPMGWRLLVPEQDAERAARLVERWRKDLESKATEEEAERAATAEEQAGETPPQG